MFSHARVCKAQLKTVKFGNAAGVTGTVRRTTSALDKDSTYSAQRPTTRARVPNSSVAQQNALPRR